MTLKTLTTFTTTLALAAGLTAAVPSATATAAPSLTSSVQQAKAIKTVKPAAKKKVSKKKKAAPSWVRTARKYLDAVGGKDVRVKDFNGRCGSSKRTVAACSYSDGSIGIHKSFNSMSTSRQRWAMTHEYAHQKQFAVWSRLMKSPTYKSLFKSDLELLANCMASQRGYTNHGVHRLCTPARLKYSANIWKGVVKD